MFAYSVIIPYRDTYNLLLKAVQSIPDRDDIQIIIVDNSEKPLDVARIPQMEKSSVLYLTSDITKGAGCARNVGLDSVAGDYVLFLDADDFFTPDAFSIFDKYLQRANDIVFFNATSIFLETGGPSRRHERINSLIKQYLKSQNLDILRYKFENPCCKMFKYEFLKRNTLRFEEIKCSNDTMFSIKSGHLAQTVEVDDSVVYVITESSSSKSLTARLPENQFIRFTVSIKQNHFLKSIGKSKYRIRILPYIVFAFFSFGFKEGFRYLKLLLMR